MLYTPNGGDCAISAKSAPILSGDHQSSWEMAPIGVQNSSFLEYAAISFLDHSKNGGGHPNAAGNAGALHTSKAATARRHLISDRP